MDAIEAQRIAGIRNNNANSAQNLPIEHDNKQQDIKDGDKKSMNALKWAGIIAVGTIAAAGIVHAVKTGKFAKLQNFTSEVVDGKRISKIGDKVLTWKDGVAFLDGQKAEGLLKFKNPAGTIITVRDGVKLSTVNPKKGFSCIFDKAGRLFKKATTVNGEKIVSRFEYNDNNKIAKIINRNTETVFEYDNEGKLTKRLINGENAPLVKISPTSETVEAKPAEQLQQVSADASKPAEAASQNAQQTANTPESTAPKPIEQAPAETEAEKVLVEPQGEPKPAEVKRLQQEVAQTESQVQDGTQQAAQQSETKSGVRNLHNADPEKIQQQASQVKTPEQLMQEALEARGGNQKSRVRDIIAITGANLKQQRANQALLRKLDPKVLQSLSDEQIDVLARSAVPVDFSRLSEFTPEELLRISVNPYARSCFGPWLQQGVYSDNQQKELFAVLCKAANKVVQ